MQPLTQTLDLVRKAQAGDRDALSRLFDRYYPRLLARVRASIGQKLRQRLESGDILQLTFAKAFEKFDSFEMRNEGAFLHWLSELAIGQIHDQADVNNAKKRNQGRAPDSLDASVGDASGDMHEWVPSKFTGPLSRTERDENKQLVEQCMDDMPEHYRRVLLLRDYDGLEWREIAAMTGKNTDSAAREEHSRAVLALAKLLRQRGLTSEAQ